MLCDSRSEHDRNVKRTVARALDGPVFVSQQRINHATLAVTKANRELSVEYFGPYEVYERIGVGGMASVCRAKKRGIEGFERVVALKRLLSHLAEDASFVKSFVREARLASKLQHANIIQIYDLGREDKVYYIAMEYVNGRDLRKVLKQTAYATGPMPVPMMLSLTLQLCDALDYAHSLHDDNGEALGIVHRDISPSNLLLAADGHLKVIDFGIAKATAASLRTSGGRVKGKFAYMAPEAIRGQPLDHRSDLFSAGIVAYEMLTARPLFASKNEYDTLQKIATESVPPPSRLNPDCPPELDEIVLTALAKEPDQRWQTAGAMHRAVDHVVKKHSLQATNREIAEWLQWAFEQPLQRKRVKHRGLRQRIVERLTGGEKPNRPRPSLRSSTGPVDVPAADKTKIEIVWGNNPQKQGDQSSKPVLPELVHRHSPSEPTSLPATTPQRTAPATQPKSTSARPASSPSRAQLSAWPQSTPQANAQRGQTTSSYRVTMHGLAPPPEIERLRAARRAASQQQSDDRRTPETDSDPAHQTEGPVEQNEGPVDQNEISAYHAEAPTQELDHPIQTSGGQSDRCDDQTLDGQQHENHGIDNLARIFDDSQITESLPTIPNAMRRPSSNALSLKEDDQDAGQTLKRFHPPAPDIEAAIEAAIESTGDAPAPRSDDAPVALSEGATTAPKSNARPASGQANTPRHPSTPPSANRAQPYTFENSLSDQRPPRRKLYRVIQITLVSILCLGAAVVGYMLVPSGSSQSRVAEDRQNRALPISVLVADPQNPSGAADAAPDLGSTAPPDAQNTRAPDRMVGRPASSPSHSLPGRPNSQTTLIRRDDGSSHVVPTDRLIRVYGKAPRVRPAQMTDDDGNPIVIRARLCIDNRGQVTDVDITDAPRALVKRSQRALKRWRYKPVKLGRTRASVCFDTEVEPRDK
ncbi:MAG: protein kinase [Proteobacteria bacterium]|nr:protein kinase [Pseudomonadota bacterium]